MCILVTWQLENCDDATDVFEKPYGVLLMWVYWLMFVLPCIGVLTHPRLGARDARLVWFLTGLVFAIIIGFRYEVGGDWLNYLPHFEETGKLGFIAAITVNGDPAYYGLNWIVAQLGGAICWVNWICALVLMSGTVTFCRYQPNPWLALLVSVPYMLIVVGMGYTRQSVALGFALLGLVALGKGHVRTFVIWVIIGALFHKSSVLLLPIAALAASRNRLLTAFLVLIAAALMYYLLLQRSADAMWANYVDADKQSQGGAIRVAMNAVPAVLLLIFRKRLLPDPQERKLWLWMIMFALACIPLVVLASSAVDRVALYLIPLQLYVFSRLPRLAKGTQARAMIVLAIIGYYAAVQFVWLNFASHADAWVPYKIALFSN